MLEQRWFAGVHTNVGGGYEHDGLANCSLHWMKEKAVALGLSVNEGFLRFYKPWFDDELRTLMTWFYHLLGRQLRAVGAGHDTHEVVEQATQAKN